MKKLQLDLDALRVDSFVAADTPAERGTVPAYQMSGVPFTQQNNCTWDALCMTYSRCPDAIPYSYPGTGGC
ncbi:MAG TPA: hypothetical protein VGC13_17075 [Longimicrobium sp.]|jgi:hypothetical protein|uniref:hypothetical protein n=1 Tax=Longimicrobium sp. TaxID=2029185 RepID=UPI002EDB9455